MTAPTTHPHQVILHSGEHGPATHIASFMAVALLRGEAAVCIAAPGTRAAAADALAAAGVDVGGARAAGRYVELDAASTLAQFRDADGVHEERFQALVGPVLDDLVDRFGAVAAYGEMVALLASEGDVVGALRLEELWQPLVAGTALRLLCGYPHALFDVPDDGGLHRVHELHDTQADPVDSTWALDLPADAEAAPLARAAVARLCEVLGVAGTEWADDAVLVVAELVGNAVRYGGSRPVLAADVHGHVVTLSVTDASERLPVPRGDLLAENGRGYLIIDALSEAWGVERLPFGKRVWARLLQP